MNRRVLALLLLAVLSKQTYSQSNDTSFGILFGEDETQLDTPEEGSGALVSGDTLNVPLIEDTETTTSTSIKDEIKCGDNVCTCSQEKDGDSIKITVDCSSKDLINIPAGIDKRVTRLLLNDNKLEEVPKEISEFQELEELDVNNNSIKGFAHGSISELPKLRTLKAANNRLLEFPQELKNSLDLRNLEELDLGYNDMREKLTADVFTHMESITSITLPETNHELIEDMCHRLHATLQQVCTNDCKVDIEECANYADDVSDLILTQSLDVAKNQDEGNNTYSEEDLTSSIKTYEEEGESEPGLNDEFLNENETEGNLNQESNKTNTSEKFMNERNSSSPDQVESSDKEEINTTETTIATISEVTSLVATSEPSVITENNLVTDNESKTVHATLRNSLSDALDTIENPISDSSINNTNSSSLEQVESSDKDEINTTETTPITISEATSLSTTAENNLMTDNETKTVDASFRNALSAAKDTIENPISESPKAISQANNNKDGSENVSITAELEYTNKTTEEVKEGVVGASSTKQGGGISNSIIAMIVAGMVVVVAGVTIGKNWKSIRNRFRPRPSPAAHASNGVTPEEVPLQNKSMV